VALTVDQADVLLVAPELSAVTDAQWAAIWVDVELEVGPVAAGSQARADRLAVQLAAHQATTRYLRSGGAATPGPLQSVSVGGVSKTYAVLQANAQSGGGALATTKYGQEYYRLVRLFGARTAVT
jgi:hypothetical protein